MISISRNCRGCGVCTRLCPTGAINIREGRAAADNRLCISCMQCVCACPAGAADGGTDFLEKDSLSGFERLVLTRHSCRSYQKEPLSEELIKKICSLAMRSPSAMNLKSVEITVISGKKLEKLSGAVKQALLLVLTPAALPCLRPFLRLLIGSRAEMIMNYPGLLKDTERDRLFFGAPHLAIVTCKRGAVMGAEDGHIAAHTAVLACHELGLGTCYIGLAESVFFLPGIRRLAGIAADRRVTGCFVLGRPDYEYYRHIAPEV